MDDDDLVGSVEPVTPIKRKRPPLRPTHYPTEDSRRDVVAWTSAGIPQEAMARLLTIDEATLRKCYREELENGVGMANGTVVGKLFQQVLAGNVTAMIFWCKTRLRWREVGPYGADDPLVIETKDHSPVDPKVLARELRAAMAEPPAGERDRPTIQ